MAVKIRFARIGKKHAPVYKIVAIDSRKKRDGKYLENLGTYNPMTKEIVQFHEDRIAYWISVGAIVSDSVKRLMKIKKVSLSNTAESKKITSEKQSELVSEEKEVPAKKVVSKTVEKKVASKPATKKESAAKAKK